VVDCPSWGVPFITSSCYACTHFTEAGALLPLTPNIGPGSLEEACLPGADISGTHTLMWVDERYDVEDGQLSGEVDLVWTRADDLSACRTSRATLRPSSPEGESARTRAGRPSRSTAAPHAHPRSLTRRSPAGPAPARRPCSDR
jgi:hypothetical protein